MANLYGPKIVTSGLVLCLDAANTKSYPGTGTTWNDLSGNNNNGTLTNGPTFNSANQGGIVFDGVDDYIAITINSTDFNDLTLACWVNITNIATDTQNFISLGVNSSAIAANTDTNNFNLGWYSNLKWHTNTKNNGSWNSELNINSNLPVNNSWNYVVGTYSTVGTSRKLYINSSYIGGDSLYNNPGAVSLIRIGGGAFGWKLIGRISNTQIYNRALSATEIAQNYNATKGRFNL